VGSVPSLNAAGLHTLLKHAGRWLEKLPELVADSFCDPDRWLQEDFFPSPREFSEGLATNGSSTLTGAARIAKDDLKGKERRKEVFEKFGLNQDCKTEPVITKSQVRDCKVTSL